ncbi:MAG: hypothetical protein E4H30_05245 [Methanomassiliicoccus sp.]|nr:MAG: hypothetical protein E4H30_05245 [Methanomassiliicoccus sp.]
MVEKGATENKAKSGKNKGSEPVPELERTKEPTLFDKNPVRTLMFKDLMFQDIMEGLRSEQISKEEMDEVLFLTVTNAVLERVGMNLPEEILSIFQENLDDYLAIAVVNKEYDIDLLALFRDQFLESEGDSFDDERALMEVLTAFEDIWWSSKKDFLRGRSPNELMDEAKAHIEGILHSDEDECCCAEYGDEEYWGARSYIIRDMWYGPMSESVMKESMPTPQRRERLFMSLTNALLDLILDVIPDFMGEDLCKSLDHNLELALVNKEAKVDILELFQADLVEFEEKWWGTGMKELDGKSPDEAMQAMARKYGI